MSLTPSRARLIRLSASSVNSRADRRPATTSAITGAASTSNFSITGGSVPSGSWARTVATFSRTSCAAASISRSRMNETKIWLCPSIVVERSSSIPLMVLTASSIRFVTWLSASSGLAPGSRVVTVTVGMSTFGKMSRPRSRYEASPRTTSETTSIVAKTGRRTQRSTSDTALRPGDRTRGGPRRPGDGLDGGAVVELGEAGGGDCLPGLDSVEDLDPPSLAEPRLHQPLLGPTVRHHEHLADADDIGERLGRHERDARVPADQHAPPREEPGLEQALTVRDTRFEGERAGRHVHHRGDARHLPREGAGAKGVDHEA